MPRNATNYSVLITRPAESAARLAARVETLGFDPVVAPMIEIADSDPGRLDPSVRRPAALIFVSRHAVTFGVPRLRAAKVALDELPLFAVGPATATALQPFTRRPVHCPATQYSSDGLLALPQLAETRIADRPIIIVRGIGGREYLCERLTARGAAVHYFEVYRRQKSATLLAESLRAAGVDRPDIAVVSSVEGLRYLAEKIEGEGLHGLLSMDLLAGAARIAGFAAELGFTNPPVIADNPGDDTIAETLERWAKTQTDNL